MQTVGLIHSPKVSSTIPNLFAEKIAADIGPPVRDVLEHTSLELAIIFGTTHTWLDLEASLSLCDVRLSNLGQRGQVGGSGAVLEKQEG